MEPSNNESEDLQENNKNNNLEENNNNNEINEDENQDNTNNINIEHNETDNEKKNTEQNEYENYNNEENNDNLYNNNNSNELKDESSHKVDDIINPNDLNIYSSKYSNLSQEELLNEISKKNKILLQLNDEKDQAKSQLNELIKQLNDLISNNSEILYKKETDPEIIQQLEKILDIRKRDLQISKKVNNTFKSQEKSIRTKANNVLNQEKMNQIENKLNEYKKDNQNLLIKIREMKNKSILNGKEMKDLKSDNLKKIKSLGGEMKTLNSKKNDYVNKFNLNNRSLDNVLKENKKLEELFNANIKENSDEIIVKNINFWMKIIKSDLNGTNDEIFNRVEDNKSAFIKEYDKRNNNNNNINPKQKRKIHLPPLDNSANNLNRLLIRARSSSPKNNNNNNNININNNNLISQKKLPNLNIFNKFSIFKQDKSKLPRYMLNKKDALKRKIIINAKNEENKIFDNNNINNILNDNIILDDYESTTDNDYRELTHKKEQYNEMNIRIENSIKDMIKTNRKKLKTVQNTINENANKLNVLKTQNNLLQTEIENLQKVLELTIEQNKIKNEIFEQSKINNNEINNTIKNDFNNDENITTDINILNKLSNKNNLSTFNDKSLEYNESQKNIKFPDISNINIDNEETHHYDREKRLQEIKNKYMNDENANDNLIEEEEVKNNNNNTEEQKDDNNQKGIIEKVNVENNNENNENNNENNENNDEIQKITNNEDDNQQQNENQQNAEVI